MFEETPRGLECFTHVVWPDGLFSGPVAYPYSGPVEQLMEKKLMPTVSLATARIYISQLEDRNDDLADAVAKQIQGRVTVAQLSGRSRVDLELAIVDSIEVDTSIDALVDAVIDLR